MNRRKQDLLLGIRVTSDLGMVSVAWIFAYFLRFSGMLPITKGVPDPALYLKLLPFIWIIWFGVLGAAGFYRRTGRHRSAFTEALDILQSCFLATLGFIAFTYVYEEYRYSRFVMLIFALVHPWLVITGRSAIRKALRRYRRKRAPRRTLVIGGGDILEHGVHMSLTGDLARGEILGVMLAGDEAEQRSGQEIAARYGLRVLPMQEDWAGFFSENPVSSVVMAVPYTAVNMLHEHLDRICDQVPDVKFVPDIVRFTRFVAGIEVIGGVPVISINESPLEGFGSVIKRIVDFGGALAALVLFGPIMAVIAVAVKLSSPGPILYRQERMGLDGKTFPMFKFRSMPVDAEKQTGAIWASKGDARPTKLGKWLRKTSLDELPQILNVLRGEMSLVGPRPERPVFVEQFRRRVPGYYLRHKTKAGITGWAQVNGWRGDTSLEKRIECDLFYIQNWSLWFDLRIIFLTILRGFTDKNAY